MSLIVFADDYCTIRILHLCGRNLANSLAQKLLSHYHTKRMDAYPDISPNALSFIH